MNEKRKSRLVYLNLFFFAVGLKHILHDYAPKNVSSSRTDPLLVDFCFDDQVSIYHLRCSIVNCSPSSLADLNRLNYYRSTNLWLIEHTKTTLKTATIGSWVNRISCVRHSIVDLND